MLVFFSVSLRRRPRKPLFVSSWQDIQINKKVATCCLTNSRVIIVYKEIITIWQTSHVNVIECDHPRVSSEHPHKNITETIIGLTEICPHCDGTKLPLLTSSWLWLMGCFTAAACLCNITNQSPGATSLLRPLFSRLVLVEARHKGVINNEKGLTLLLGYWRPGWCNISWG